MTLQKSNRKLNFILVFLIGLLAGAICYLFAEWLIPTNVTNITTHDFALANRIGFIYPAFVGLWLGWYQKSWIRALIGLLCSVFIGFIYMYFCFYQNFLLIMTAFPCLLGGLLSMLIGSNQSYWLKGMFIRMLKGFLAGFVLGVVYMVTLNIGSTVFISPFADWVDEKIYIKMMWRVGPIALGLSSGLFFLLIRWAVGLNKFKIPIIGNETSQEGFKSDAA